MSKNQLVAGIEEKFSNIENQIQILLFRQETFSHTFCHFQIPILLLFILPFLHSGIISDLTLSMEMSGIMLNEISSKLLRIFSYYWNTKNLSTCT